MTRILYKVSTRVFLVLAILIAFLPYLDLRVLRMAGDEKVYITQAVEMARGGRWFVQTLADEPSYYKGPLHYILVRIGLFLFGDRLIAGTWMNGVLALLAGLAMHQIGRRRWNDKAGLLLGAATALNVGVFSHSLASQMEVELTAFYAFAIAALSLSKGPKDFKHDLFFWLAAGISGWSKSPLHSALIGCGGLLYWAISGQLRARAFSPQAWAALGIGVFAGIVAYLPPYFLDHDAFVATFLGREQFEKANNNRSWDYVMKPLIHFAIPWTLVIAAGVIHAFKARRTILKKADMPMVKLGIGMALPTLLFWCTWTYKGQNYNMPAMPALMLFGWACFNGNVPRWVFRGMGLVGVLAMAVAAAAVGHFWPLPEWWSLGWITLAFFMMGVFVTIFLFAEDVRALVAGATAFFIAFGAFITPLGQREMLDIRQFIKDNPEATYHYYNLDPSIWSEWALLQLTLHKKVYGLHKPEQLSEATKPGHVILAQNTDNLNVVLKYAAQNKLPKPTVTPWTRWLTKGKTPEGVSRWKQAWQSHDLRQLEREFFIIKF